ncbi:hypothetical protein LTR94_037701, partial [Friedmanniomyces endolithicus]
MAAGRAERPGGGHDARTAHLAGGDGLAQADVVPVRGAQVAHRREAGVQRLARVGHGQRRPEAVVVFEA